MPSRYAKKSRGLDNQNSVRVLMAGFRCACGMRWWQELLSPRETCIRCGSFVTRGCTDWRRYPEGLRIEVEEPR